MAEQGRFRCGRCGYTTDWFDEGEEQAGAEEIHYHSATEHPEEVAEIKDMPPGPARQRRIQALEKLEVRGRPSGGSSGGCLMLVLATVSSVIAGLWAYVAAL
ncbi:hypothetical protein [Streptomyces sp. NPDC058770]|uniref:hypothetical protein n=1 Tax=unclassified Streptomyces TaxID=2593676 RepID=UPI003684D649